MHVVALIPPPSDPQIAAMAYGGVLGESWTVSAYGSQDEVPDEVAAVAEVVIVPPPVPVDARLIKRMPKLRLIQIPGHGFDHVSLDDAQAANVPVATVASSGAEAHTVAEMTILLAGAASRRVLEADAFMREGQWGGLVMLQRGVFELAGKTIGLVGFGRIGREVATRARAFDMTVIYHVARAPLPEETETGAAYRDLDALLAESDIVSLHAPLTASTRGMIGARELGLMKQTAVLVNTARGPLVDAAALAAALRDGTIRAAAIDVFDPEPPAADNPLLSAPNCILSPHMSGVTAESVMRIVQAALRNVADLREGLPLRDVLEPGASH